MPASVAKPKARQLANSIINAIKLEIRQHPPGPCAIAGDLNCNPMNLNPLKQLLVEDSWKDLGAHAHIWGRDRDEHTCMAHNAKQPTRRDFILTNPSLFTQVENFEVVWNSSIPTHAALRMQVRKGNDQRCQHVAHRPDSIKAALESHCISQFHNWHEMQHKHTHKLWLIHLHDFHRKLDDKLRRSKAERDRALRDCQTTEWWKLFAKDL